MGFGEITAVALKLAKRSRKRHGENCWKKLGLSPINWNFSTFILAKICYTYPNGDKVYIIDIVWICEDYSGEVKIDPDEVAELRWFGVNEIPEISPPLRRVFADFVEFVKKRDGV